MGTSPSLDAIDETNLSQALEPALAGGGTLLDLFVALSTRAPLQLPGHVFRKTLSKLHLLEVFQELLGDPRILEELDSVWCAAQDGQSFVEFHFARPLERPQDTAVGRVTTRFQPIVRFVVSPEGEATLRPGDITIHWLVLSEAVHIHLQRVVGDTGVTEDVALISAGNVLSRRFPLTPLTPPAPPAEPTELPPSEETLRLVHDITGRARLHVFALYQNPGLKQRLEKQLTGLPGIERVWASALTSNLLIVYTQTVTLGNIQEWVTCIVHETEVAVAWGDYETRLPWHTLKPKAIAEHWATSLTTGLSQETAVTRLQQFGANKLSEPAGRSGLSILLDQFKSLPVAMLGASALLSIFTGGVADAVVILGVVALNAGIGYATESWAERTITSLSRVSEPRALAIRDGRQRELPGPLLVPGDLILLKRGMTVAADARLLQVENLTIDESKLTGESVPVEKSPARLHVANVPLANRHNMVYRGTIVTGGSARALVVATGGATEVGQIQRLMVESRQPETPLQRQLDYLGSQLGLLSMGVCGAVFVVGLLRGQGSLPMLKVAVSLAVAAVPEGLPTVATTTLALGLRRLRQQQVYVRRLDAVETLGALQYVCLDKTGTVTVNRMTLVEVFAGMRRYRARNGRFRHASEIVGNGQATDLETLLRLAVLCSDVELDVGEPGPLLKGTPTEVALAQAAVDVGFDLDGLRQQYPLLRSRLRSERRNFMDTLHTAPDGKRLLAVKGHPLQVLEMCDRQMQDGAILPLTEADRLAISTRNDRMAGRALRVLGVAYQPEDGQPEESNNLIWLGLTGIADPPRQEMGALIAQLHRAGIHTTMITGDQSATAAAVAKEIGLGRNGRLQTLDSIHLEELEPDVLRSLAQNVDVFSRVSPAHKLQIVKALQKSGYVVAMTGDGVNDGPALRAADIGIAMGRQGNEVAQEVADIVMRDDDLAALIFAVEQGRAIYDDIKKAIHFILSSNASEIMLMFVTTTAGAGAVLNPMQLLWINLVTDVFPEIALGLEPPEEDVLRRPPRNSHAPMFANRDIQRIAFQGALLTGSALVAYGWGLARYGLGIQANTLAFTSLTTAQLLHAVSCRSEPHSVFDSSPYPSNPYLSAAVGGGVALQGLTVLLPGLRRLLGITPLGMVDWLVTGTTAVTPFFINELLKLMRRSPEPDEE